MEKSPKKTYDDLSDLEKEIFNNYHNVWAVHPECLRYFFDDLTLMVVESDEFAPREKQERVDFVSRIMQIHEMILDIKAHLDDIKHVIVHKTMEEAV